MRYLFALALALLLAQTIFAADTRGLTVVAKDSVTNQSGEVKLYNKSYAVIIGIDRYQNLPPDRQLAYAVKDAEGISATLKKHFKFDRIATLYNQEASKERIMKLLTSELPRDMGPEDSVFLFWAGHGNQDSSADGEIGYLIPYDGSADEIYKNITMTEIRDTVSKKLPAKHVFYAFDACYSGLLTTRAVDTKSRRDLAYMKEITKERVRQVLTAGSKGQEVLDGGRNGHSVFTGRLIEILEAAGDYITANEIQAIIKEKVYGDAIGRGLNQKPDFGRLSGSGDFVFIPNIEQKVVDGKADLERTTSEIRKLEQQIAEAAKQHDEQKRREAEREKEILIARQKVEEESQKQLSREQERQEQLKREQAEFEKQQMQQQAELARKKQEEENRLAELRKQAATSAPTGSTTSLDAAVAEIKRLSAEIDALESRFRSEQSAAEKRISERYDTLIADMKRQREQAADTPLVKGEFEKESAFRERQKNRFVQYDSRIADLGRQKKDELAQSQQTLSEALTVQTGKLKSSLKQLSEREYTVDTSSLSLEMGSYDAERELFPVKLVNKSGSPVEVNVKGAVAVPIDSAAQFKVQWQSGIVRPDVRVRAGDRKVIRIALANAAVASDSDNYLMLYDNGEFITISEKKRRLEEERKRLAEEKVAQERKARELRERLASTGIKMVSVPGGCFQMGNTFGGGDSDEKPVHEVCVSDFAIGKYEVTQGQWKWIMGNNPSNFSGCGDNCPVEQVSWNDVHQFIQRLNSQTGSSFRLPTESEWEYAARSGGKWEQYSGGDNIVDFAWYSDNSGSKTHPVGQKQPNGLGIYDMSGNVWEWVSDWKGSYPSGRQQDPQGPPTGSNRVARGGSWYRNAGYARAAYRYDNSPNYRDYYLGFRLASPVQ
ncbi:MAG: SUMF1/EgtB/PvdO family nonheme iron enzyme [Desulfuromonadales bacterium]